MDALTINLFGQFQICYAEQAITGLQLRRAQELLSYLLLHRDVTSDSANQFVYDGRSRLIQVTNAQGTTRYRINGLGQRVAKVGAQTGSHFVYDEAGHLIGEYTLQGRPVQETVYLGDMPVAALKDGTHFFFYTDHLSTPRAIADPSGKVVWRWEGDPFGEALPNQDPDRDGRTFTYNLRFPGQYFDRETGLAYNYFRDYDPRTGRYIQADPIGLAGGMNPYRYAEGNPLSYYDPYGLFDVAGSGNCAGSQGLSDLDALIDKFFREYDAAHPKPPSTIDPQTEVAISRLHPRVQELAREHIRQASMFVCGGRLSPMPAGENKG